MTRTLLAILLACAAGTPRIAAAALSPDLAALASVPRVEVPVALVAKALAEPVKSRPYQFAVPVELELSAEQGSWRAQGALRSWRLRLRSPGAVSLSVQLLAPELPAGSAVWVYDPHGARVRGPFGPERIGASGLWTPTLAGDEIVVEIVTPETSAPDLKLGAARAFHGFRDWNYAAAAESGSCNIDVACPSAAPWTQEAGAVAMIEIGGAYLCTGQLINNVRQDQRRLFLTANHCGVDGANGPADTMFFYFGYQRSGCGNDGGTTVDSAILQGARRLAHDVQSDFTLLVITDTEPLPDGVYFAGWDATGTGAANGVSIHHPLGDPKKIAFFDQPATHDSVNVGSGCPIEAWRVTWNSGTTEAGSSGGGLWNPAHRLIGVLSGGSASCENPSGNDYFARLDRGWTPNARTDRQLKAHLDPDNTCVASVPGLDPDTSPQPGAVSATAQNTRCEGPASSCTSRGGGGALDLLTLAVLVLARRRRRLARHDQ